ncbi:MAG: ABC transporter permease [Candidatus Marinimicrobia bacterium]|nr:ABC transporter permease [Candidatus Neomarinimicrobiota bacterium]MCK9483497.1 ABC transporter permease [Candidatus Neomarinimicrobiota bacterium]MCK9559708.1 ABC transporter permease [Candidatus Neomarinimicrobiota bacterium]MDD5061695.1 ABC transporter permease [Candidatus Neomarinimicrobiota bacterium]MDD5229816.1 ABC transporter permease [Candidatus Neomarinimicrobiota bacterium]
MTPFLIKLWENIKIAIRALVQSKMRTVLTTIGIIIGVLTVVSVASIIEGLNRGFANQIANLGSNALYVQKYPWASMEDFSKFRNRPNVILKEADFIRERMRLAEAVSPSTGTRQDIRSRGKTLNGISVNGVTNNYDVVTGLVIEEGRFFSFAEIERDKNNVVIGWEIKENLFENRNVLGEKIKIGTTNYTVIGVTEKRGNFLGQSLDAEVYVPLGTVFKNFGWHRSISIAVKVTDATRVDEARDELRFLMRLARKLKPTDEDNFSINQQDVLMDMYNKLTGGLYTAAIGIGTLSLLVGGIGIMNIMLVSVTERRKEIGIRMALGAKRKVITFQFIVESIIICGVGGVIAIILSYLVSIIISKITPFPSAVPAWSVFMGLGFSALIGLFFGIYPASKAARLNPIECLRYE